MKTEDTVLENRLIGAWGHFSERVSRRFIGRALSQIQKWSWRLGTKKNKDRKCDQREEENGHQKELLSYSHSNYQ